jgi:hypothetical protein
MMPVPVPESTIEIEVIPGVFYRYRQLTVMELGDRFVKIQAATTEAELKAAIHGIIEHDGLWWIRE